MIKRMETENIKVGLIAHDPTTETGFDVVLTINGNDNKLTVDELNELVRVVANMWEVNSLYNFTSESIAERKRWEEEEKNPVSIGGPVTGKLSSLRRF